MWAYVYYIYNTIHMYIDMLTPVKKLLLESNWKPITTTTTCENRQRSYQSLPKPIQHDENLSAYKEVSEWSMFHSAFRRNEHPYICVPVWRTSARDLRGKDLRGSTRLRRLLKGIIWSGRTFFFLHLLILYLLSLSQFLPLGKSSYTFDPQNRWSLLFHATVSLSLTFFYIGFCFLGGEGRVYKSLWGGV